MKRYSNTFLVLLSAYITCLLLSNLIAGKLWQPFAGVTLPAAVVLFPVTYILGDIFSEVYGLKKTRTVIWLGFAACFLAAMVYMLTIALPHPDSFSAQSAYETVLGSTPRVLLASLAGYLFGEMSNAVVLTRIRRATGAKWLWVRTIVSTLVGEGFDSVIFITVAFAGTLPGDVLRQMMLYQYLFKVAYEALVTPLTYAAVRFVRKKETSPEREAACAE